MSHYIEKKKKVSHSVTRFKVILYNIDVTAMCSVMEWLLTNWLVNVAETFTDILKHCIHQTSVAKFVKFML